MATILLIEEDDEMRPVLRHTLREDGYEVLVAVDEETAMAWLSTGPVNADLILVNLVGRSTAEALAAARRVRERNGADGTTPVVVIADKYGEELEGTDVSAGESQWVTYPESSAQLHQLLARLTGQNGGLGSRE